jgi:hypothetical protein
VDLYLSAWKKYNVLNGRASRKEYLLFNLIGMLIAFILAIMMFYGMVTSDRPRVVGGGFARTILLIYCLAGIRPLFALTVRRLHDTNHSAWWFLINLVPFIGVFIFMFTLMSKGTKGANRFGEAPLK